MLHWPPAESTANLRSSGSQGIHYFILAFGDDMIQDAGVSFVDNSDNASLPHRQGDGPKSRCPSVSSDKCLQHLGTRLGTQSH